VRKFFKKWTPTLILAIIQAYQGTAAGMVIRAFVDYTHKVWTSERDPSIEDIFLAGGGNLQFSFDSWRLCANSSL
jgi:hypothetical protein